MSAFRIELDDQSLDFRASAVHEFHDAVIYAPEEDGYRYFVKGVSVTRAEALDACAAAIAARLEKKMETHKLVRVSVGVTNLPNTYRKVWVRK